MPPLVLPRLDKRGVFTIIFILSKLPSQRELALLKKGFVIFLECRKVFFFVWRGGGGSRSMVVPVSHRVVA